MSRTFRGVINLDVRDSKPDWEAFLAEGERVSSAELAAREFELHPDDPIVIRAGGATSNTRNSPLRG